MEVIKHHEMVASLAKTGAAILADLTPHDVHCWHMASALLGECAEYLDNDGRQNAIEELGDIEFYAEGLRQGYGITREDVRYADMHRVPCRPLINAAADLFDLIKKQVIYNKEPTREQLIAAFVRLDYALEGERIDNGVTLEHVLQANIDKLRVRYEGLKYTDAAAQERADKKHHYDPATDDPRLAR